MALNPVGFVPVHDFGVPMTIGCMAWEDISGGQFVFASGASDPVSSGINSFVTSDVSVCTGGSGNNFVGLAVQNTGSNDYVAVATNVVALVRANGTVTCGLTQVCDGADAVHDGTTAGHVIGRALTTATSGGYAVVQFGHY